MTPRHKLLLIQIYAHIVFLVGLILLPATLSIPTIILSQILYVGICGTAFFHRTVSHKNAINPVIEKILILLSWVGMSGSAMAWAGTHRKHHRYSDTEKDPHSPQYQGKIKTYWYSSGAGDIMRYVPDLLRQPWYLFQHKYYFEGLIVLHLLGIAFLSFAYYWTLLIVPAFLMWFSGSLINVFCHDDKGPVNVPILGYFSGGEGWHKNHHEQPANSSFRHWADWGGYLHKLMSVK